MLTACSTNGGRPAAGPTTASPEVAATTAAQGIPPEPEVAVTVVNRADTHVEAGDYDVDLAAATPITFNGDSITAGGAGITVDGATVAITAPGDYRLSGSLEDGQVVVNSPAKGSVRLILADVTLNSSTSAPINIVDADKVILFLPDGSQNTITDAASYIYPSAEVDEPNAAIFSNADLSIAGTGALTVTGNFNDGINGDDGLVIAGGSISVTAVDDGIRGKDYLVVEGGALTITAQDDGLKADNDKDPELGYILVSAGALNITSGGDAISARTIAAITGGEFTLTTGGGAGNLSAETRSAKGIKGDVSLVIDGGTFSIDAADDALHSNGGLTINNGRLTLASADDAVHADGSVTINGGEITVTQSYEGLESAIITVNGGTIHIIASDDGVNVAGGVDGSGMLRGMGGPGGMGSRQDAAAYTGDLRLYIHGGYLWVDAQGDGIDVGGAFEMTGGLVLVNGPTEQMNGPLDYDAGFNISGGCFVATGSAGMAQTAGPASTQNSALIFLDATQPGGTPLAVLDSAGQMVFAFTPARAYQSVAFSSPELAQGQTYTLYTGGSFTDASADGFAEDGSYTPGAQSASFTINSVVTQVGAGGQGSGRGPRP